MAANKNLVDARLAKELSGPRKIQALLKARGYTYATVAGEVTKRHPERGCWGEQVKASLRGERDYPHIRETIAALIDLPLTDVDGLLGVPYTTVTPNNSEEQRA